MDNSSVHHAASVKAAIPALEVAGVSFCDLPPYSPELNPIEGLWRQVKDQDVPERSHPTDHALQMAVEAALAARASHPANDAGLTSTCFVRLGLLGDVKLAAGHERLDRDQ